MLIKTRLGIDTERLVESKACLIKQPKQIGTQISELRANWRAVLIGSTYCDERVRVVLQLPTSRPNLTATCGRWGGRGSTVFWEVAAIHAMIGF